MMTENIPTTELDELIKELAIENSYLKGKIEVLEKMSYNSNLSSSEPKSKTSIDKSNLTYQELVEVAPKDGKCFYIEVENNPTGFGGRKKLLAYLTIDKKTIGTNLIENHTDNTPDGFWSGDWENDYKGKFKLIED